MVVKIPRELIHELDTLIGTLSNGDSEERERALHLLIDHEQQGNIPIEALLDFSKEKEIPRLTYAIFALGRNGSSKAVERLLELSETYLYENPVMLENVIDALGSSGSTQSVPLLLRLLGLKTGWGRIFKHLSSRREESRRRAEFNRVYTRSATARALARVGGLQAAECVAPLLEDTDPVVRWHAVKLIKDANCRDHHEWLKRLADSDTHETVREIAALALEQLKHLPPHMNN